MPMYFSRLRRTLVASLLLPAAASAKLPTRSQVTVAGTLGEAPFQATLEPDGAGSHWLKVPARLLDAAGATPGDTVALEIAPRLDPVDDLGQEGGDAGEADRRGDRQAGLRQSPRLLLRSLRHVQQGQHGRA